MGANDITKMLLLAISEKYQPECFIYRLNVIVARARNRVVRSAPSGIGDIVGTIRGRSIMCEVKAGKDRLSPVQRAVRAAHERAGGVYIVARDVEQAMRELAFAVEGRNG